MDAMISHVSDFQDHLSRQFALNIEVPTNAIRAANLFVVISDLLPEESTRTLGGTRGLNKTVGERIGKSRCRTQIVIVRCHELSRLAKTLLVQVQAARQTGRRHKDTESAAQHGPGS